VRFSLGFPPGAGFPREEFAPACSSPWCISRGGCSSTVRSPERSAPAYF
jgi:hypothetical protein